MEQEQRNKWAHTKRNRVAPDPFGGVYIPMDPPRLQTVSDNVNKKTVPNEALEEVNNDLFKFRIMFLSCFLG